MRIKVDEDLPPAVTEKLRNAGHDAAGVVEQGMSGWKECRRQSRLASHHPHEGEILDEIDSLQDDDGWTA